MITQDRAREIAALYITPNPADRNITAFATGHPGMVAGELIAEVSRELNAAQSGAAYRHEPDAVGELSELLSYVEREYGRYVVRTFTTAYEPWEEEQDEPTEIDSWDDVHTFATLRECADWLDREGLSHPSDFPGPFDSRTWLLLADGERPHGWDGNYTGRREEVTAHAEHGFTDRTWGAVVTSVSK